MRVFVWRSLIDENAEVYMHPRLGTNIKRARNAEESASCTLARWWMGCGERLDVRQSGRVLLGRLFQGEGMG